MVQIKHSGKSMEQRIKDREKNSGDHANADIVTRQGEGARRTFHNIHHSANHTKPRGHEPSGEHE
jgi:hypothetical protein